MLFPISILLLPVSRDFWEIDHMGRERKSKLKKMRPQFLVLCEGDTEITYVNMLRQNYRLPIKIVARKVGCRVSQRLINRYRKDLAGAVDVESTFLMFDGDKPEIVDTILSCKGVPLVSKPCIEVWFFAHFRVPPETSVSSAECVRQLNKIKNWEMYQKGFLSSTQEKQLWTNRKTAVDNMKAKSSESNQFSSIYQFIQKLEEASEQQ